jgi:hypothetical protein
MTVIARPSKFPALTERNLAIHQALLTLTASKVSESEEVLACFDCIQIIVDGLKPGENIKLLNGVRITQEDMAALYRKIWNEYFSSK